MAPLCPNKLSADLAAMVTCTRISVDHVPHVIGVPRESNVKNVHVCVLHVDGCQAFDRVWHHGLFFKMAEKIDSTLLKVFIELHLRAELVLSNSGGYYDNNFSFDACAVPNDEYMSHICLPMEV
ncbi:hypothetical protein MAR_028003 [Mya arenaria]|uniref:Uncharacterized protein n=1 Tax=Mya arenaria TaxID=6604 RepID=A0ABY7DDD3_MYAAR|nr:hypothetical protein MAR_028003 [Mya arenaria]